MSEWITVISLILFGLALIIAEIIIVPGTTIVGIIGFIFLIMGVGFSFKYFGTDTGWIIVGATAVVSGAALYLSFKADVWKRFSLKSAITSKVNEGEFNSLSVGNEGHAVSALRPVGKAEISGKLYEVRSIGDYIETGSKVKIFKIEGGQIIVQPI